MWGVVVLIGRSVEVEIGYEVVLAMALALSTVA